MTDVTQWSDRDAPVRLLAAYPQIFVTDFERALDFYEVRLGFRRVYVHGEPPFYGLVERDGVGLNLRHVDRAPVEASARDGEQLLSANIPVEGVAALFAEFERRGVPCAQPLRRQAWGAEDFLVRDPDDNLLCFAQAALRT